MTQINTSILEAVPYEFVGRETTLTVSTKEFNCVCPKTGLPDFAKLTITYGPHKKIVELKSLKLYLNSYRNHGSFHNKAANLILEHLVALLEPKWMDITARFARRGGIKTHVEVE